MTHISPFFESGGLQRSNRLHRLSLKGVSKQHQQQENEETEEEEEEERHQQHQHHQHQHHQRQYPCSRVTVKVRRRRRSRERPITAVLRRDRVVLLIGLLLAVACVAFLAYRGARLLPRDPPRETEELRRDSYELQRSPLETEEDRLRREIIGLEDILLRKKSLVGVEPGAPLLLRGGDSGGSAAHAAETGRRNVGPRDEGNPYSLIRPGRDGQLTPPTLPTPPTPPRAPPAAPAAPAAPAGGLAGEAMFGAGAVLRPSLEARPSLVREPVPLIVGGTDGSGTRGVVDLLQRLKVRMVVEDRGTMDVHGSPYMAKGGWPAVVRPVLDWSHGARYDPQGAPRALRDTTIDALGKLRAHMHKSEANLRPSSDGRKASYVSWGFKAPVSMLLVPFFSEAWGNVKFLHVVRDGRDIAFSGNQTPVSKFFKETFPAGSRGQGLREPSLKAIAMWDTWNVGLYDWAGNQEESRVGGLDYLLLHTEDLLDPDAKFAAIKDVAEFVGSPLSDVELCCIATEPSKDMGSHTTSRKERGKVTARFGKWKGKVEGNPILSKSLHEEGKRGLHIFGYEPERALRASDGYQCPLEHSKSCPQPLPPAGRPRTSRIKNTRKNTEVPADVADTPTCVELAPHLDYKGFDIQVGNTEEHVGCCQECRTMPGCTHFTFDYKTGNCYLKSGKGAASPKTGLVSGMVLVP